MFLGKDSPNIVSCADVGLLGLNDFSRFGLLVVREAVAVLVANNLHDQWGALTVNNVEANLHTEGT